MRMDVFGASGGIGRLVTERLLTDGHDVTALVRRPAVFCESTRQSLLLPSIARGPAV